MHKQISIPKQKTLFSKSIQICLCTLYVETDILYILSIFLVNFSPSGTLIEDCVTSENYVSLCLYVQGPIRCPETDPVANSCKMDQAEYEDWVCSFSVTASQFHSKYYKPSEYTLVAVNLTNIGATSTYQIKTF